MFLSLEAFCYIFFNYSKYKRKKKNIFTDLRPGIQVKREMKQSFLDGRIRAFSSFLAKLWAIYKKWFIFWEKKKSNLFSGENTTGKLEFRETDTQICGFTESLYMTCLDAKKLQENFKGYTAFPKIPLFLNCFHWWNISFQTILWRLYIPL